MNYIKIYENLISKSKNRQIVGYYEKHHIIPRCMGGSDEPSNIAKLTPEEHYVAHQLLIRIYPNNYKLVKAAAMMIPDRGTNKMYGWIRRRLSKAQSQCQSGMGNSQYGTRWIHNEDLKLSKKISKSDPLPSGWHEGRKLKFDPSPVELTKEQEKVKAKVQQIEYLNYLYSIYAKDGFDGVKRIGYKHSQPNLVRSFARHLPHFVPQNGKPRKLSN